MLRATIASLTRSLLARANRTIVALDAPGCDPIIDTFRLLLHQTSSPLVFDIGANTGHFAKSCLEAHPSCRLHAFEPFPAVFTVLNGLQQAFPHRIECHCCALDDQPGPRYLHLNTQSVTNSLLPNSSAAAAFQPANYATPTGRVHVQVDTLSQFCAARSIDQIDLLKTDAQGTDLRILKGAESMIMSGQIRAILTEVLFVSLYEGQGWFHETFTWLTGRGFHFVNFYDMHHHEGRQAKWADALFIHDSLFQTAP